MCISGTPADCYRFSCIVLAGPPADCPFFHVGFYPDRRLTVHCYKKFISGPPADGSQRVNAHFLVQDGSRGGGREGVGWGLGKYMEERWGWMEGVVSYN